MGYYFDCQMNDSRICLENILTAIQDGAICLNYAEVLDFEKNSGGEIIGATVKDKELGKQIKIKSKVVVNATGPWSDIIKQKDDDTIAKRLANSKGVHIITKRVINDYKALALRFKDRS